MTKPMFIETPGPLIGLLSDPHGHAGRTRRACALLAEREIDLLLGLGDFCAEDVIEELGSAGRSDGGRIPVRIVFGNMDIDSEGCARLAKHLGVIVEDGASWLRYGETTLMGHHGHLGEFERAAMGAGVDYLCHGHSHQMRDEQVGSTRFINPGALSRASAYTVATLNLQTDRLEFIDIDE